MHHIEPRRNPQVFGAILIAIGVLLLLSQLVDSQFFRLNFGAIPWPMFQIVPGVAIAVFGLWLARQIPAITVLGVVITVTGLIFWFQQATGTYQTWAYAWALVAPTSIGLGLLLHGTVTRQQSLINLGINLTIIGLVLFGIGFSFFEFAINLSGLGDSLIGRLVGPVLLMVFGIYLLLRRGSGQANEKAKNI